MRVAVTGATGFVGRHAVRALRALGADVVAISRHPAPAGEAGVVPLALDIATARPRDLAAIGAPDAMLHLAWDGLPDYRGSIHTGQVDGHAAFLDACLDAGLPRLAVAGTCLEYGLQEGELDESTPSRPVTAYGEAKRRLRAHLLDRRAREPFGLAWLRLFYVYGPGQAPGSLLPQLRAAVEAGRERFGLSPGDQQRDFLPVEVAADRIARIVLGHADPGTVNICSGRPTTVEAFVRERLREWGADLALDLGARPYPDYEPFAFWGDPARQNALVAS